MLTFHRLRLSDFSDDSETIQALYRIFSKTINEAMSYKAFRVYYFYHKPHLLDVTFIKARDETVGFISATFYKHFLNGKDYTFCRGAVGLAEEHRQGIITGWQLCMKYIAYKMQHPFEAVYLTGFLTNPLMYAMVCKYAHKVYPKHGVSTPPGIQRLVDELIIFYKLQKKVLAPFVIKLHFHVPMTESALQKIKKSTDKDVLHYLSMNSNFQQDMGLLTILPVDWNNMFLTSLICLIARPIRKSIKRWRFKRLTPYNLNSIDQTKPQME